MKDGMQKKDYAIDFVECLALPDKLKICILKNKFLLKDLELEYEEAKIEEAKDIPTVLVLDEAKIPEQKSMPRRVLLVVSIFLVNMILNILFIISYANYNKNLELNT